MILKLFGVLFLFDHKKYVNKKVCNSYFCKRKIGNEENKSDFEIRVRLYLSTYLRLGHSYWKVQFLVNRFGSTISLHVFFVHTKLGNAVCAQFDFVRDLCVLNKQI